MTQDYIYNVITRVAQMNDGVPNGALYSKVRDEVLDDLKHCINSLVEDKRIRFNRTVNGELIFRKNE